VSNFSPPPNQNPNPDPNPNSINNPNYPNNPNQNAGLAINLQAVFTVWRLLRTYLADLPKSIQIILILLSGGVITKLTPEALELIESMIIDPPPSPGIEEPVLVNTVDEFKIDMKAICNTQHIKPNGFRNTRGDAKLSNDPNVWPVFQWDCIYKNTIIGEDGQPRDSIETKGLNLTEDYCKKQHGEQFAAAYKHFDQPNSWYCTNARDRKILKKLPSAIEATVEEVPD
jgi:hypothetical protein